MSELCRALGTTPHRQRLLKNLIAYRALISSDGYVEGLQFIDGSFVEDIERAEARGPKDIDVFSILVPPAKYIANPVLWTASGLLFWQSEIADNPKNKIRFSLDCYAIMLDVSNIRFFLDRSLYWYSLFSHKRLTNAWKGFVAVPLDPADDQLASTSLGVP